MQLATRLRRRLSWLGVMLVLLALVVGLSTASSAVEMVNADDGDVGPTDVNPDFANEFDFNAGADKFRIAPLPSGTGFDISWVSTVDEQGFVDVAATASDLANQEDTYARVDDRRIGGFGAFPATAFGDFVNQKTHYHQATGFGAGSTVHFTVISGTDQSGPHQIALPSGSVLGLGNAVNGSLTFDGGGAVDQCLIYVRGEVDFFGANVSLWGQTISQGGGFSVPYDGLRQHPSGSAFKNINAALGINSGDAAHGFRVKAQCDVDTNGEFSFNTTEITAIAGNYLGADLSVSQPASASIADVTIDENVAGGNATVTVTLSKVHAADVTVDVGTTADTATGGGTDYTAPAVTVTVDQGDTTAEITIAINDDQLDEADETFTVTISDGGGLNGAGIGTDTATVTIADDDDLPVLSIDDQTVVGEGDGSADFTVILSPVSGRTVTVEVDSNSGTATDGVDYGNVGETVTFLAGETQQTVTVNIIDDGNFEGDEDYTLDLSGVTNATIGDAQSDGVIEDNDTPGTTADTDTTDEDTVLPANGSVLDNDDQLTAGAGGTLDAIKQSDPAKGVLDFTDGAGTFSFDPNGEFESLPFGGSEDVSFDYQARFTGGGGVFSSTDQTVTVTVTGVNDAPVALADTVVIDPGSSRNFDVRVNDIDVDTDQIPEELEVNGPFDFVSLNGSTLDLQPDGTFTYDPATFVGVQTFTYDVTDNRGATSLTRAEVTLSQGPTWKITSNVNEIDEDSSQVILTVQLVNPTSTPSSVSVQTIDGTAVAGSDFVALNRLVTLGIGNTTEEVILQIVNDSPSVREGVEELQVQLTGESNNSVISGNDSTVDIAIDDPQDIPTITIVDTQVIEGSETPGVTNDEGGTYALVTILLTGRTLFEPEVTVSTDQTGETTSDAQEGSDYGFSEETIVFTGTGQFVPSTSTQFMVEIFDDDIDEHAETFGIVLSNPVEANGVPFITDDHPDGTVTIIDDDNAPSLKVINTVVNEGDGIISVEVELTGASSEGVSVDVGTGLGTATAGADYSTDDPTQPQTLVWGPDEDGSQFLDVDIIDDAEEEDAESVSIVIQGATLDTATSDAAPTAGLPATIADGSGLLTIEDNEPVVAVIGITSLGELLPGDWFFVVASDGDDIDGEGGTFSASLLDIVNEDLQPLSVDDEGGLSFLALAHDFDRIRSKITDGVYLGQVDDDQLEGRSTVDATVDGTSSQTTVNLLDARTNRNFFLWPDHLNFTGLALVPDADNDEFSEILAQGVRTAPEFHDRIMEVGGDRSPTLADVVQTIFTYEGGLWRTYNTADPITGTPGGGSVTKAVPFQGMLIKTRPWVLDSEGNNINVFDQVTVRDSAVPYDVPVRMNIRGPFIDSTTNSPLSPPSKVLTFGFNLIAPHIWDETAFDTVFQGSGGDFRAIFSAAVSFEQVATPIDDDPIDVDISISHVTEAASLEGSIFSLPGFLRPELAYWVRVSSGAPTLVATGPEDLDLFF